VRRGAKRTTILILGHQDCAVCHPQTKSRVAGEKRKSTIRSPSPPNNRKTPAQGLTAYDILLNARPISSRRNHPVLRRLAQSSYITLGTEGGSQSADARGWPTHSMDAPDVSARRRNSTWHRAARAGSALFAAFAGKKRNAPGRSLRRFVAPSLAAWADGATLKRPRPKPEAFR